VPHPEKTDTRNLKVITDPGDRESVWQNSSMFPAEAVQPSVTSHTF